MKESSFQKEAPGKEHMKGVSPKRNRQYEHIKEQLEDSGKSEEKAKEEAARTVNKQRAEHGETKGSRVDNSVLPDLPDRYFLETSTFDVDDYPDLGIRLAQGTWYDGGDDPLPDAVRHEDLDDYEKDWPGNDDRDIDYAHCPMCDGPGNLLGQMGTRIHYRCRNCGTDFSHKLEPSAGEQREEPFGINTPEHAGDQYSGDQQDMSMGFPQEFGTTANLEDAVEVNEFTLQALKDSSGNPLKAGERYLMRHPSYNVPDVIRILNLEDNRVEAAIESDVHGEFPIHLKHDDGYSLELYNEEHHKHARKNYSAQEQDDLVNENLDGRARNYDKLKLEGTHYNLQEETDPYFLLGL